MTLNVFHTLKSVLIMHCKPCIDISLSFVGSIVVSYS